MKQYEIEVTRTVVVFVDANNEEEALDRVYEEAFYCTDGETNATVVDSWDIEEE